MPPIPNKSSLLQKIENAFADVNYPGDEHLVIQSYGEEPELVKQHFGGQKDWRRMSAEELDFHEALSFFSDEAFRFFLPAFLIADINDALSFNDPSIRICWALTPQANEQKIAKAWGGETMGERARKCFDAFTKEQVHAIVSYLHYRIAKNEYNPSIQQALENYWLQRSIRDH